MSCNILAPHCSADINFPHNDYHYSLRFLGILASFFKFKTSWRTIYDAKPWHKIEVHWAALHVHYYYLELKWSHCHWLNLSKARQWAELGRWWQWQAFLQPCLKCMRQELILPFAFDFECRIDPYLPKLGSGLHAHALAGFMNLVPVPHPILMLAQLPFPIPIPPLATRVWETMEAGQNKEGNWPVYLQSLLQSLTAAAQSRPRVQPATVHAGQPGHQATQASPTISVQHLQQQVCDHILLP